MTATGTRTPPIESLTVAQVRQAETRLLIRNMLALAWRGVPFCRQIFFAGGVGLAGVGFGGIFTRQPLPLMLIGGGLTAAGLCVPLRRGTWIRR